jgi:uncharacterized repeat protein (TIGR04138 family)
MPRPSFPECLAAILQRDPRSDAHAYFFVRDGLEFTVRRLDRPLSGPGRHVTGRELLEGLRLFALTEFGPMARTVLRTWGVNRTEDFGQIVFNLVGQGVLGKTDQDRPEDFASVYDFDDAFVAPFLPSRAAPPPAPPENRPGGPGGDAPRTGETP